MLSKTILVVIFCILKINGKVVLEGTKRQSVDVLKRFVTKEILWISNVLSLICYLLLYINVQIYFSVIVIMRKLTSVTI